MGEVSLSGPEEACDAVKKHGRGKRRLVLPVLEKPVSAVKQQ
jgi:hypothetical protein